MSKKGFTLVELLGVIIILTIIISLVLPKITSAVKSKQSDVENVNKKIIYAAVELYLKNIYDLDEIEVGSKFCVEIRSLEEKNYLKDVKNIYTKESISDKAVLAEYNNGFFYTIYDSLEECNSVID